MYNLARDATTFLWKSGFLLFRTLSGKFMRVSAALKSPGISVLAPLSFKEHMVFQPDGRGSKKGVVS